jgi:hypothetical protein
VLDRPAQRRARLLPLLLLKLGQPVVAEPRFVRGLLVLAPRELPVQALLALPQQLRQRRDPLRQRRPAEVDEGNPGLEAVGHHPVLHAPEPPVGQHLRTRTPACNLSDRSSHQKVSCGGEQKLGLF